MNDLNKGVQVGMKHRNNMPGTSVIHTFPLGGVSALGSSDIYVRWTQLRFHSNRQQSHGVSVFLIVFLMLLNMRLNVSVTNVPLHLPQTALSKKLNKTKQKHTYTHIQHM